MIGREQVLPVVADGTIGESTAGAFVDAAVAASRHCLAQPARTEDGGQQR